MIQLIEQLEAIRHFAKDIHYHAHGGEFYSVHILMDRVAEGIVEQIDNIYEIGFLGKMNNAPKSADVLKIASAYIPEIDDDTNENISRLLDLITTTINTIQELIGDDPAIDNMLGNIAESLTQKRGLLWRQIISPTPLGNYPA